MNKSVNTDLADMTREELISVNTDLADMTREELIAEIGRLRQMTAGKPEKPIEYVKIAFFSIFAACVYGIAHNLVTAHVCVEYFLPPIHPVIFPTNSPIILALIWGIIATWWVGLLLGILLAAVCRLGQRPKLTVMNIVSPALLLFVSLYAISMLLGVIGYVVGHSGVLAWLVHCDIAPERHARFMFNVVAHDSAYLFGAIGGIVLMFHLWKKRRTLVEKSDTK